LRRVPSRGKIAFVKKPFHLLSRRERQIVDTVHSLGEGSAREVVEAMGEPDALDSVRITLGVLAKQGVLKRRSEGRRHIYAPAQSATAARQSAWKQMTRTFFGGSASRALLALVDLSGDQLAAKDLEELAALVSEKAAAKARRKTR
jgi:predicted transcriptional regulator